MRSKAGAGLLLNLPIAFLMAVLCQTIGMGPAFAEYAHCYRGEPPAGSKVSEERRVQLFFLGYALSPVIYRGMCRLTDERDANYIDWLLSHPGCARNSDIGDEFHKILEVDLETLPDFDNLPVVRREHPEFMAEMCAIVRTLPMPDGVSSDWQSPEYRKAWSAGEIEMQGIREQFRKEHPGVLK
ncbi:MAG: hypothetical protein AB8B85_16530 [Paracoccaceae bacterium]